MCVCMYIFVGRYTLLATFKCIIHYRLVHLLSCTGMKSLRGQIHVFILYFSQASLSSLCKVDTTVSWKNELYDYFPVSWRFPYSHSLDPVKHLYWEVGGQNTDSGGQLRERR